MGVEIERKFLVDKRIWAKESPERSQPFRQAYLTDDQLKTIRIRTAGDQGYLTIKSRGKGISRQEFEYKIPVAEAHTLIDNFAQNVIEKTRHFITYGGKLWEVDEFQGANAGLLVAEIELASEDEAFEKPPWLATEVSLDTRYLNSNLAKNPYCSWEKGR